jgi:cell division protein FtsL
VASLAPSAAEAAVRRPRASSRKATVARQRRVAGSVVWIGIVALLLAGVVAVNVAVLRLNVHLDQLSRERAKLRADNAALQSQLASAAASLRIERLAEEQGYTPADAAHTTYLNIAP